MASLVSDEAAGEKAGKRVVHVWGNVQPAQMRATGVELYKRLPGWLESGAIRVRGFALCGRGWLTSACAVKPNKVEVLPGGLAGIPEGLKRMEEDKVSGTKLVARPQETV